MDAGNIRSVASLSNDDMGEEDVEANVVVVLNYYDVSKGEYVEGQTQFILPADSFRDEKALEWILSPKSADDSSLDLFNDLIASEFNQRSEQPKPTQLQLMMINSAFDRAGSLSLMKNTNA